MSIISDADEDAYNRLLRPRNPVTRRKLRSRLLGMLLIECSLQER
jgi:hypothetical protein